MQISIILLIIQKFWHHLYADFLRVQILSENFSDAVSIHIQLICHCWTVNNYIPSFWHDQYKFWSWSFKALHFFGLSPTSFFKLFESLKNMCDIVSSLYICCGIPLLLMEFPQMYQKPSLFVLCAHWMIENMYIKEFDGCRCLRSQLHRFTLRRGCGYSCYSSSEVWVWNRIFVTPALELLIHLECVNSFSYVIMECI